MARLSTVFRARYRLTFSATLDSWARWTVRRVGKRYQDLALDRSPLEQDEHGQQQDQADPTQHVADAGEYATGNAQHLSRVQRLLQDAARQFDSVLREPGHEIRPVRSAAGPGSMAVRWRSRSAMSRSPCRTPIRRRARTARRARWPASTGTPWPDQPLHRRHTDDRQHHGQQNWHENRLRSPCSRDDDHEAGTGQQQRMAFVRRPSLLIPCPDLSPVIRFTFPRQSNLPGPRATATVPTYRSLVNASELGTVHDNVGPLALFLVGLLDFVLAVVASAHAILHKREVRAAIGWVGVIWLVPFGGGLLYLLLGVNRIRRKGARIQERDHPAFRKSGRVPPSTGRAPGPPRCDPVDRGTRPSGGESDAASAAAGKPDRPPGVR